MRTLDQAVRDLKVIDDLLMGLESNGGWIVRIGNEQVSVPPPMQGNILRELRKPLVSEIRRMVDAL